MSEKVCSEFPNDLSLIILSKLPLKSLMRFRCVQKSWSDLPQNLHFMRIYCKNLTYDNNDGSSLLLIHRIQTAYASKLALLSGESYEHMVELDWPPPIDRTCDLLVMEPCINGIICLTLEKLDALHNKTVLWNPITEEFKVIHPGLVDLPGIDYMMDNFGFGYDRVKEDYKVIRLVSCILNSEDERLLDWNDLDEHGLPSYNSPDIPEPFWQIYSLKNDCWRNIELKIDYIFKVQSFDDSVYLNGVCHWWGSQDITSEVLIPEELLVSFDISSEVSIITPIPENLLTSNNHVEKRLVVFNGSIAMISNLGDNYIDITMLGEVGVKESWIKLFTIGPLPCIVCPIGTGNKGEILFMKNDDELAWFDFNTQMTVEIDIKRVKVYQTINYKENFDPIEGFGKE